MDYHYRMLEAMGVADQALINIHVGGAYGNKEKRLVDFMKTFKRCRLPLKAHDS